MAANRGGEVDKGVELLQLAHTRDREQTLDGPFAVVATIAKTDLPPLDRRPQGPFRGVVGWLDSVDVDKREEVLVLDEHRRCEIAHVVVGGVDVAVAERRERLLNWQRFGDQLITGARAAAD